MQLIPGVDRADDSRRNRVLASVGIWLVVLSTVALLPGAMDRWVLPKVAVAVVGCLIASLADRTGRLPTPVIVLVSAGAVVLVVCALLGATPLAQLFGRWPRYEGLVTLPVYLAALWTGARSVGPSAVAGRREAVYGAIATVAVAVGVISILESTGLRPISSNLARPGSLLGNASDQGAVGVMCCAILLVAAIARIGSGVPSFRRWYPALGAVFAAATVVLSESRTALAALAAVSLIALLVVIVTVRPRRRGRVAITALSLALVGFVGITFALPAVRNRILGGGTLLGVFGDDRGSLWQETTRLIAAHPLFGVGPSGFVDALPAYTTPSWFARTGLGVTTDSPHSAILQAAVAGGIPLMLVALALAVFVIVRGIRVVRRTETPAGQRELVLGSMLALVGFAIALLATFTSPGTTILAAFLAGIAVADSPHAARPEVGGHRLTLARTAALSVWAILVLVTTIGELPLEAATMDAARGELGASAERFAIARALRPWDTDITLIEAQSFTAAAGRKVDGAAAPALRWARLAHRELPASVPGAKALAAAQEFDGRLAAATGTLIALDAVAPNDPSTLARLGAVYVLRGRWAKAQPVLEQTVRLNPTDSASWHALGNVDAKLGDAQGVARVRAALARLAAAE